MTSGGEEGPVSVWWLSFADGARPVGSQFLGVAIVPAADPIEAVKTAHALRCNPGGEVAFMQVAPDVAMRIDDHWIGRLLTREDVAELVTDVGPAA
jgi:hypothetical protein